MTKKSWAKKKPKLTTKWFEQVSSENPLPDHPRPQFSRDDWLNLNGLWDYAITDNKQEELPAFQGKILVPFPMESALSGVQKQLYPKERLWYRRIFSLPGEWKQKRIILHFGAVDWQVTVWLNDNKIGEHKGGYSPFSFDITEEVLFGKKNTLIVKVFDPSEKGKQPSGKQWIKPGIVFYTTISGIWQTVWLECVPLNYIEKVKLIPDIDKEQLIFESIVSINNKSNDNSVELKIRVKENKIIKTEILTKPNKQIAIKIDKPILWSPEQPFLYDLELELLQNKQIIDEVSSYFAMRKFDLQKDDQGILRFHLNNNPYFMMGLLDQGYWPDGLYTAPTDEALQWDIKLTKEFGFNTIRKHLKTEPARWYYHCDRLGVLVWQDMINGGGKMGIIPQFVVYAMGLKLNDTRCYWKTGQGKKSRRENFEKELKEMVDSLINIPSICLWVPFNESWGQFDAKRIADWLMDYDPTRLVDHASGWFDQKGGHFISKHDYVDKFRIEESDPSRGIILSETGGYTQMIVEHSWNPKKKYGYKKFTSQKELDEAYKNLVEKILLPAKSRGLSGAIYTQTTDVEIEYNGLVTYDREIKKLTPQSIAKMNELLTNNN